MLTPIELQNKQLKTGRGYSRKEADIFLRELYSDYETLYKENLELKDKIDVLSEGVQYYKTIETTLQKALVLAEKTATETKDAAYAQAEAIGKEAKNNAEIIKREALLKAEALEKISNDKSEALIKEAKEYSQKIIKDAKEKSEELLISSQEESEKIRSKCIMLVQQYNQFKIQLRKLASSQIELIDEDYFEIYSPSIKAIIDDNFEPSDTIENHNEKDNSSAAKTDEDEQIEPKLDQFSYSFQSDQKGQKEIPHEYSCSDDKKEGTQVEEDIDCITPAAEMEEIKPNVDNLKHEQDTLESVLPTDENLKMKQTSGIQKNEIENNDFMQETEPAIQSNDNLPEPEKENNLKTEKETLDTLLRELRKDLSQKDTTKNQSEQTFEFINGED